MCVRWCGYVRHKFNAAVHFWVFFVRRDRLELLYIANIVFGDIRVMKRARPSYLRTHRKRHGLTQREVGFLIGLKSGQIISRYEDNSFMPHLRSALACQVIFDVVPHELFPSMYRDIEQFTLERVVALIETLSGQTLTPVIARKQESLHKMLRRLELTNSDV